MEAFSIKGLSKSPAIFDPLKLRWLNAQYIRELSAEEFTRHAMPYYEKAGIAHMNTDILCKILQPRVEVFSELPEMVDFLAKLDEGYSIELFTNKKSKTDAQISREVLEFVIPELKALEAWDETHIHDLLMGLAQQER